MNRTMHFHRVGTLGVTGLVASWLAASNSAAAAPLSPDDPLAKIGHIVIGFEENRSFDNMFGWFPGADGLSNAGHARSRSIWTGAPPREAPAGNEYLRTAGRTRPALSFEPAERAVRDQRLCPGERAHRGSGPSLLSGAAADRRWQNGEVRRRLRCRRPGYGLLRSVAERALASGEGLRARRSDVPFGVRRIDAQSHPPRLFVCLRLAERAGRDRRQARCGWEDAQGRPGLAGYVVTGRSVFLYAPTDTEPARLVPPQTMPHIGDRLDAKGVGWAWYAGGYDDALAGRPDPKFQYHHQSLAYFQNLAPGTPGQRAHLKDLKDLYADIER